LETVDPPDPEVLGEPHGSELRHVREGVHAGLTTLQVAASAISTAESRFAFAALDAALSYLQAELLPACRAEEATLFGAVDGLMGVANSCHAMKSQHTTIIRMVGDLAQAIEAARAEADVAAYARYLEPLLYGLYALARAHLESEDEAYLGMLEALLSEAQVAALAESYVAALEDGPPPTA